MPRNSLTPKVPKSGPCPDCEMYLDESVPDDVAWHREIHRNASKLRKRFGGAPHPMPDLRLLAGNEDIADLLVLRGMPSDEQRAYLDWNYSLWKAVSANRTSGAPSFEAFQRDRGRGR